MLVSLLESDKVQQTNRAAAELAGAPDVWPHIPSASSSEPAPELWHNSHGELVSRPGKWPMQGAGIGFHQQGLLSQSPELYGSLRRMVEGWVETHRQRLEQQQAQAQLAQEQQQAHAQQQAQAQELTLAQQMRQAQEQQQAQAQLAQLDADTEAQVAPLPQAPVAPLLSQAQLAQLAAEAEADDEAQGPAGQQYYAVDLNPSSDEETEQPQVAQTL